jgi:hypothetical protein
MSLESINKKLKFSFSLSEQVLSISLFCLIWIFLYKAIFLNIKELFPFAAVLGDIIYSVSSSIIASGIFYYFVVYRPLKHKHNLMKDLLGRILPQFNLHYILIKQDLYKSKGLPVPERLPENHEDFIKVCEGINLNSKPPLIFGNPTYTPANWFEYFAIYFAKQDSIIDATKYYWEEIPIELKIALQDIQITNIHAALASYELNKFSDKLSDLGGPLWVYLNLLNGVDEIYKLKMKI